MVTWPVDYVTAIVVDGRVINLGNLWRGDDICSGDELCLNLQEVTAFNIGTYSLSNHVKSHVSQTFAHTRTSPETVLLLVPRVRKVCISFALVIHA